MFTTGLKLSTVTRTFTRLLSSGRYEKLIVSRKGKNSEVGLIQMNKPKALNALCPELISEIGSAVREMDADSSIRCLVLTGSERFFSGKNSH